MFWLFIYSSISSFTSKDSDYRGPDADARFLESVLEEEKKINEWKKENEKKNHNLSDDEEKKYQEEKHCHICKDRILILNKDPSLRAQALAEIKDLLVKNELPTDKIPSLKLVKKQLREISLQLHPDKNVDESEEAKNAKQNRLNIFLMLIRS